MKIHFLYLILLSKANLTQKYKEKSQRLVKTNQDLVKIIQGIKITRS